MRAPAICRRSGHLADRGPVRTATGRLRVLLAVGVAVIASLAVLAGSAGGYKPAAHAAVDSAHVTSVPDVTAQAKRASTTVVSLAGTIRSWNLAASFREPLLEQLGYVDVALQQGNQLGARALLTVWAARAQQLTAAGVLSSAEGDQYQSLASRIESEIPGPGRVTKFTQVGAPPIAQDALGECGVNLTASGIVNTIHSFVTSAIGLIPTLGGVLSGLYSVIWTGVSSVSKTQTWRCLREAAAKIVAKTYASFLDKLIEGLQADVYVYVQYLNNSDPADVKEAWRHWVPLQDLLNADFPFFKGVNPDTGKPEPYAYIYLPEFALFMNLDLANLRDGVLHGKEIGLNDADIKTYKAFFTAKDNPYEGNIVVNAMDYANATYATGLKDSKNPYPVTYNNFNQLGMTYPVSATRDAYNTEQAFNLFMIPAVKDQAYNWPYMDPVKYDSDVTKVPPNTRVLWSYAYGSNVSSFEACTFFTAPCCTCGSPKMNPNSGTLTSPLSYMDFRTTCEHPANSGSDRCAGDKDGTWVRAFQVFWANPGESTVRAGPFYGAACSTATCAGPSVRLSAGDDGKPVVKVDGGPTPRTCGVQHAVGGCDYSGLCRLVISALRFTRADKSQTLVGQAKKIAADFSVSFPDEVLADVYSAGNQTTERTGCKWGYNSPSSMVFGFQYADSFAPAVTGAPPPKRPPSFTG